MRKLSAVIGMIALAMYASADVRNIRPPITGEGTLGTTTYKWGEVNAVNGYYSNLILGGQNITNKFLSPYDGESGEVFYANGLGGGVWGAASSPTNGISQAVAESLFATVAQGAKADAALPKDGSTPMTGDLDMDGYDIDDAGVVTADVIEVENNTSQAMDNQIISLSIDFTAKFGYGGSLDDWVGADSGTGFYCVDADDAADFSLKYLTTNNYIKLIGSSFDLGPYIAKITGFGECAANDVPVAGLLIGDHYVLFDYSTNVTRTNNVGAAKFGSKLATITPDIGSSYKAAAAITIDYMYTTGGLAPSAGSFFVFLTWSSNLTTPHVSSFRRCVVPPYGLAQEYNDMYMSEVNYLKNELIFFNGVGSQISVDSNGVDSNRFNATAVYTSSYATIIPNN